MLTSLVGSYPQPEWLLDREKLRSRLPPRVRASDFWRIDPQYLEEAQDAATLAAIRDQERAGLDIITDGEIRRESYSNRVVTALDGVDVDNPGTTLDRNGNPSPVPRIVGPVARRGADPDRATPSSCARTPTARSRSRSPGRSRCRCRPRTTTTATRGRVAAAFADVVRAEVARPVRGRRGHRAARRAVDGVARRAGARVRRRDPAARARRRARHDRAAHLLRLPAVRARPRAPVPLPGRAGRQRPSTRSRSRPPRHSSTSRCSASWAGKRSFSA